MDGQKECGHGYVGTACTYERENDSIQYRTGKMFVKNSLTAELDWLSKGIDSGLIIDPGLVVRFLQDKVNSL